MAETWLLIPLLLVVFTPVYYMCAIAIFGSGSRFADAVREWLSHVFSPWTLVAPPFPPPDLFLWFLLCSGVVVGGYWWVQRLLSGT
jgi:hypothetical protein